jgi:hypothetical protein
MVENVKALSLRQLICNCGSRATATPATHQGLWRVHDQPSLQHRVGFGPSKQLSEPESAQAKPPHWPQFSTWVAPAAANRTQRDGLGRIANHNLCGCVVFVVSRNASSSYTAPAPQVLGTTLLPSPAQKESSLTHCQYLQVAGNMHLSRQQAIRRGMLQSYLQQCSQCKSVGCFARTHHSE